MKNKCIMLFLIIIISFLFLNVVSAIDDNNDTIGSDNFCNDEIIVEDILIQKDDFLKSNLNQTYLISDGVDDVAPSITYITPATTFKDNLSVEITCDDSNATIYYTLDGSNPLNSSTRFIYSQPFIINESTTVHYTAIDNVGNYPKFDVGSVATTQPHIFIKQEVYVEIDCGSKVYYTLDGSDPLFSDTKLEYVSPFYIPNQTILRVVSYMISMDLYRFNRYIINFYMSDFSVTYLKENNKINSSDAIWGQYQGDANNTGVTLYNGSLTNITKWSNLGIASSGSAVVDKDGHIYIAGEDGYLYCLNNQGLIIWRYGTASKIICTPTIGVNGNIYFSNWMNSTLYCISPNGKLLFKYHLGDYNTGSSPVFGNDGTLYVLTGTDNSSRLFALKDNKLVWNCNLPSITGSTPVIGSDGTLYMVSTHHCLVAVNWDGTIRFIKSISGEGVKELAYSDTISIGDNGLLYVLNQPYDAAIYDTSGSITRYAHFDWRNLINAYLPNGTLVWSIGKESAGTPSYYNGVLYVNGKNSLLAINSTSGRILWSSPLNSANFSSSSPLISGNEIIYISHGNMVFAFNLTGEQLWNYTLPGKYGGAISLSSPTLSDDGTLIVTTNQGIFAFNDLSADFTCEHVTDTERTIQFTDLSTRGNNSYYWSFGDGFYSSDQNPSHVYQKAGKYRVELLVNHNSINLLRNTTITVENWDITPPNPVQAKINNRTFKGGVYNETQIVELVSSDSTSSFIIYYTVDGSNPINSSTRRTYVEPISIETYTVVNAVAIDSWDNIAKLSTFVFNISDSINVNEKVNSTLINKIQELLDNAEPNSKFVFDYDTLYGANFTINKPLNIITNNNTKLIGNGAQPVFTIGENAKGSCINGFTIVNDGTDGILIKNTEDIMVKDSIVQTKDAIAINIINSTQTTIKDTSIDNSTNGVIVNQSTNTILQRLNIRNSYDNGVWILNSKRTTLRDSLLENNGENPYFSSAHQVLLDGSKNTNVLNNEINYGVFGIRLKNNNLDVTIDNNTVYEGVGDAILLEGRFTNIDIIHNALDGCFMGINFNGYSENVNVESNLIQKIHSHAGEPDSGDEYDAFYGFKHTSDLYGSYHNAIQVWELASNFHKGVHLENNVCILVEHRAWEARKTNTYIQSGCDGYGYNLWDGSDSYHGLTSGATHFREGFVDLVIDRVGDSSYRLRLINKRTGEYLSGIPSFDVKFTAGTYSQTVKFVDSQAVATFDVASSITSINAKISVEIQKSASWDLPIAEGYKSSNRDHDPGYEAGEAINNPNPKVPSIDEYKKSHQPGNSNGQGTGEGQGNGQGNGNGNGGSYGTHGGAQKGREGDLEGNANNLVRTSNGNLPDIGVFQAQKDNDISTEGSSSGDSINSDDSSSEDSPNAYEVNKIINMENNNMVLTLVVLLLCLFLLIFGWSRRENADDEEL